MYRIIVLVALCVTAVWAATTTHPHTTHAHTTHAHSTREPNVMENYKFVYDGVTHKMVMVKNKECYIFTLSDDERAGVHTDAGIRAIELKLVNLVSFATKTVTTKDQLSKTLARDCGHATSFFLASF